MLAKRRKKPDVVLRTTDLEELVKILEKDNGVKVVRENGDVRIFLTGNNVETSHIGFSMKKKNRRKNVLDRLIEIKTEETNSNSYYRLSSAIIAK